MEQESKSMEIQRYDATLERSDVGAFMRYADHAASLKAAQDAIAVEKRALLNANAALREDAERMRVMREALTTIEACKEHPECSAARLARAVLASTVPVYGPAIVAPKFITHECHCPVEHYSDIPAGTCLVCGGAAPVAEAGQKEGEKS